MKKIIRSAAAVLFLCLLVLNPIRSFADEGRSVRWLQGSWSDRQLLVSACQNMDPTLLENTQNPEVYRQLYDIVTGTFPGLLTDPQAYSEMERFSAAWRYLVNTAVYDSDTARFPDTPHFARLLLHNTGACQHFADTLAFLLDCFEIENDEVFGHFDPSVGGELHIWNLVCLDGMWYHSDTSQTIPTFLYNDADLRPRYYRWNGNQTICTAPSLETGDALPRQEWEGAFSYMAGTNILLDWDSAQTGTDVVLPTRTAVIGDGFAGTAVTSVTLPVGLLSIGSAAFRDCTALTRINLPNSLQHIGSSAFSGTAIKEVTIPASVQLTVGAFQNMVLEKVTFAPGCTQVGASMFLNTPTLRDVDLPTSITHIGQQAFSGCTSLNELDLSHLTCDVGSFAFAFTGLTSIHLPSLSVLQSCVLHHCPNLTEVVLPEDLLVLKDNFQNCPALGDLRIPAGVLAIDSTCFVTYGTDPLPPNLNIVCAEGSVAYWDALSKGLSFTADPTMTAGSAPIVHPYSPTSGGLNCTIDYDSRCVRIFGYDAQSLQLENGTLVIPDLYQVGTGDFISYYPVTEITSNALFAAPMTQIRLPAGLTTLGVGAFNACQQLTSLDLSGCHFLTEVPARLCEGASALTHAELGNSVTSVGDYAFHQSGLTSFRSGSALETIGAYAFADTDLDNVYLGSAVKTIGAYAFANLSTEHCAFYFGGDAPFLGDGALGTIPRQSVVLHTPGAGGFHTSDYTFHEVGTYDGNSPVILLDRFNVYAPSSNGTQMVLVHGFRTEWGYENLAYAAFYDADNRMVACARRYLTTSDSHTINNIQFNDVRIPKSAVRMSVYLMNYGTFAPVSRAAHFDLIAP